jgi:hypothetical protein
VGDAGLQEKMVQRREFWHACARSSCSVLLSREEINMQTRRHSLCVSLLWFTAALLLLPCTARWTWTLLLLWLLLQRRSLSVTGF